MVEEEYAIGTETSGDRVETDGLVPSAMQSGVAEPEMEVDPEVSRIPSLRLLEDFQRLLRLSR
jgi:hypothetical protein